MAKIPVIHTLPAKAIIADDHPYNLGNLGQIGTKASYQTIQDADLLIMIGTNFPFVKYLPKKILKRFKLILKKKISVTVSTSMLVS